MLLVAADLDLPNIVNNHVPDFFAAVRVSQEVLSKCCCGDLGEVFVLGDGEHLPFSQAGEPNAILKRDHVHPIQSPALPAAAPPQRAATQLLIQQLP